MKVVCVTTWSPYNQPLADITLPNLYEYAGRHGYAVYEHKIEDGRFHFKKNEVFQELFDDDYDIIFYKDIDSIITNIGMSIFNFIDLKHDLYITEDKTELNGGVMILVNTDWCRKINDFVLSQRQEYNNEQNVYNAFRDDVIKRRIKVLPHPSINSYLYELYPEFGKQTHEQGQWEEGDFLLHLPAIPLEKRIEILKNIPITR